MHGQPNGSSLLISGLGMARRSGDGVRDPLGGGENRRLDPIVAGKIKSFDCDIVYSNGTFV